MNLTRLSLLTLTGLHMLLTPLWEAKACGCTDKSGASCAGACCNVNGAGNCECYDIGQHGCS
jgi:hypothetical protein